jgi:hypothetical protein
VPKCAFTALGTGAAYRAVDNKIQRQDVAIHSALS